MPACPNCYGLGFNEDSDENCHLCEGTGILKNEEQQEEKEKLPPAFDQDNYGEDADWWKGDEEVKD